MQFHKNPFEGPKIFWEEPPQGPPDIERLHLASHSFSEMERLGDVCKTRHLHPVKRSILAASKRKSGEVTH